MKLQIIIGSTRQGRMSDRAAKWVANSAKAVDGVDAELIDLRDYPLPFFDEEISPQYNPNRTPSPEVQKWLDKVAEADAYVLVTPEYNRSYSAVLKNALDHLDFQLANKPVALVAHGSTGGAQAVAHLRAVVPGVQAVTIPAATFFTDRVGEKIDEEGNLDEQIKANPYGPQVALDNSLKQLLMYSDALAEARAKAA
jgi:NAD(P)H-dependent FMN reductase